MLEAVYKTSVFTLKKVNAILDLFNQVKNTIQKELGIMESVKAGKETLYLNQGLFEILSYYILTNDSADAIMAIWIIKIIKS